LKLTEKLVNSRLRILIALVVLAIAGGLFILSKRDTLAPIAWQRYHNPQIALFLDQHNAPLAMAIGNFYFNGGAYDLVSAESAYRKALAIDPKILWGHFQLARIIFVKGDFDGALSEINKELEANPENLRSLYVRGLIYGYRSQPGDLAKAEADYRRFIQWVPTEWAGYNDLAWILTKESKFQDVKNIIDTALAKASYGQENPWLWNNLGVAQLNLAEYSDATISFTKAQAYAEKLTEADWVKSYPGNNPQSASTGLTAFKNAIQEQVILGLPQHPLCSDVCKGLCQSCGNNLNLSACGCSPFTGHPAFAVLKGLKK